MPEFIMPLASAECARSFQSLDAFTQGYVEAMFFTSTGSGDDGELEHATFGDLAPETLARIIADCAAFQSDNAALIEAACEHAGYDTESAGRDFWYSRNGHGVGFWDRGLGELGDKLHKACRHRDLSLYMGDDELLYLA